MKKIVCKPAPEVELELSGGDSVLLRFDLLSIMNLQENEGGIGGIMSQGIPEMAASIIYATAKDHNDNFTLEKARAIVSNMSVDNITEIINTYAEAMGVELNSAQSEMSKKMMAQFLNTLK